VYGASSACGRFIRSRVLLLVDRSCGRCRGFMRSSCSVQSSSCIGFFFFSFNRSSSFKPFDMLACSQSFFFDGKIDCSVAVGWMDLIVTLDLIIVEFFGRIRHRLPVEKLLATSGYHKVICLNSECKPWIIHILSLLVILSTVPWKMDRLPHQCHIIT